MAARRFRLSAREIKIIEGLARGETRRAVAYRLGISIHTADTHIRRAYAKLGAHVAIECLAVLCNWAS